MAKSILVVDDEPVVVEITKRKLEERVYEVQTAGNGNEAFLRLKSKIPDLILLDILLPHISGIELCKKFKKNPATRDIPVIFYTSIDTPKHLIDYASYGAQDYIQKAMPPEELLNSVRSILKI